MTLMTLMQQRNPSLSPKNTTLSSNKAQSKNVGTSRSSISQHLQLSPHRYNMMTSLNSSEKDGGQASIAPPGGISSTIQYLMSSMMNNTKSKGSDVITSKHNEASLQTEDGHFDAPQTVNKIEVRKSQQMKDISHLNQAIIAGSSKAQVMKGSETIT